MKQHTGDLVNKHAARWIWYPGDFELHHSLKLHCRREERAYMWPAIWGLDDCRHNVRFRREAVTVVPETVKVTGRGVGYFMVDGRKYPFGASVDLDAGAHRIEIQVAKVDGLPSVFVEGEVFASHSLWEADGMSHDWVAAGCSDGEMFLSPEDDPEVFPFTYDRWEVISECEVDGGWLLDFGRQTFAKLCFENVRGDREIPVFFGESETEALDTQWSYLRDVVPGGVSSWEMPARAFRYVYVPFPERCYDVFALYEYLPLTQRGHFHCSDEKLNQIWDVAAYTFHLNSREFFLDGIKRDRWVWSGDAFQSYFVNFYLFMDAPITKRTILALRGRDPIETHINTILDYSLYWLMSIYEYWRFSGDGDFVCAVWPKMCSMADFCLGRRNADGFLEGQPKDWVFVDWADLDKDGALCAVQILFACAMEAMAECAQVVRRVCDERADAMRADAGQIDGLSQAMEQMDWAAEYARYRQLAVDLRRKIDEKFWDSELHAYVDSYSSGRRHVTRHANIFAVLFGFADEGRREEILHGVLENDRIDPITTPYFRFYEMESLCALGQFKKVRQDILDYWGGMLDLGATTIWEEYDPRQAVPEHYAMYGDPYGKSLCHAWGAGPIYLLGRYFLGVEPTSVGYETFVCEPHLGGLEWMSGTVPLPNGEVTVSVQPTELRVTASVPGGTLRWEGQEYALVPGEELLVRLGGCE